MNKIIITFLLILPVALKAQKPELIDGIIGIVGNEIVLQSDLVTSSLEMNNGKPATGVQLCEVYENLMYQKLLLNQSKLDSIEVTDAEVQSQVERRLDYFIQMFGSVEEFEKYYNKTTMQMKSEYFDLIKDQLLVQRMQDDITKNVKVTPSDVQRYFVTIPKDSLPLIGEQVQYSQIVISPKVLDADKINLVAFLDSIRSRLIEGRTSMTLEAAKWSEDPGSKYKGGCYPLQRKGSFVPEYEAAVDNTAEGQYSPVFESEYGYHFLKVVEKRGEFYESCHILMSPKVKRDALSLARLQLDSVRTMLASDTIDFSRAAVRYSTEEETRNAGGKVINPQTNGLKHDVATLPAELNLILLNLLLGEVSEPVLTSGPDGNQYYVIYRLDSKTPAHTANLKDDYEIFKSITEANARQKEVDKWVKKRLASTYVAVSPDYQLCEFQFPWLKPGR